MKKKINFYLNIGLLSIKPKIIVCNVDEGSLTKGNKLLQKASNLNTLMKKL